VLDLFVKVIINMLPVLYFNVTLYCYMCKSIASFAFFLIKYKLVQLLFNVIVHDLFVKVLINMYPAARYLCFTLLSRSTLTRIRVLLVLLFSNEVK